MINQPGHIRSFQTTISFIFPTVPGRTARFDGYPIMDGGPTKNSGQWIAWSLEAIVNRQLSTVNFPMLDSPFAS
jgi:hypothetical protein